MSSFTMSNYGGTSATPDEYMGLTVNEMRKEKDQVLQKLREEDLRRQTMRPENTHFDSSSGMVTVGTDWSANPFYLSPPIGCDPGLSKDAIKDAMEGSFPYYTEPNQGCDCGEFSESEEQLMRYKVKFLYLSKPKLRRKYEGMRYCCILKKQVKMKNK